jgi:hypothetical protein
MPNQHHLKKAVRARMAQTGENYTTARRAVLATTDELSPARPAVAGVQSCGCITVVSIGEDVDRDLAKALSKIVAAGGTVRRASFVEIEASAHFMPRSCPHTPKGWAPAPPPPGPNEYKVRARKPRYSYAKDTFRVEVWTRYHTSWLGAGSICLLADGDWVATTGWLEADGTVKLHESGRRKGHPYPHKTFKSKDKAVAWVGRTHARRIIADAKQRWEAREANPKPRTGPAPEVLSDGQPCPPMKAGEVWECKTFGSRYLILDEPEIDEHWSTKTKQVVRVRARDLSRDDRHPEDWLRGTGTSLTESVITSLFRVEAAGV